MNKLIGLIGFGVIGSHIYRGVLEEKSIDVGFIFETDPAKTKGVDSSLLLTSFAEFESRPVDLVVETATPQAVREFGQQVVKKSDFLIFSLTSLADDKFRQEMETTAVRSGTRIYVPHGAILGLDGIRDGRKMLESVQITTTKNPKNIDLQGKIIDKPYVLYDGSTKEACVRYPRNVNVHAAVALAGLGFEKTRSKMVADPDCNAMSHEIEVNGKGLHWKIKVESLPAGKGAVTGVFTPESAYQTVKRICVDNVGIQIP